MITFKDFLNEKQMNTKTFSATTNRLGNSAKIGFEFELIVPKDVNFHGGGGDDTDPIDIDDLNTLQDFEQYFEPNSKFAQIRHEFKDWVDNPDDDITTLHDFITSNFRTYAAFIAHYKLFPTFGWHEKGVSVYVAPEADRANISGTAYNMKDSLGKIVGKPVRVSTTYHGQKKLSNVWYIEPDTSIEPEDGGHGLEVVSPPLVMNEAVEMLSKITSWMKKHNLKTNASTGLHINVSIPDIRTKLDPVKLILFMGEEYVAKAFDRVGNTFSSSHITAIIAGVKQYGRIPSTASDMISFAKRYLRSAKYSSVNIGQLENGYLEFRIAGGVDYHTDMAKLKKTIYRFVTAVELACDPTEERQEYIKKLSNLFNKAKDEIQSVTKDDAHKLPEAFHRLYKYNADIMELWETYQKAANSDIQSSMRHTITALAYVTLDTVKNFRTSIDIKERLEFKRLFKNCALQSSDVDEYYGSDHIGRLYFKKEFAL